MVKSKLMTVIAVTVFASAIQCTANAAETKKAGTAMNLPKPLENKVFNSMVGQWVGEDNMMGTKMTDKMNIKWSLNHQFITMHLNSKAKDSKKEYEGLGVFGVDANGKAKTWWFDSWGANAMSSGTGTFKGDELIIRGGNKIFTETRSFTVKGNELIMEAKGTMTMNGKKTPFEQKVVYKK